MATFSIGNTGFHGFDYLAMMDGDVSKLPYALRVLAENAARNDASGTAVQNVNARSGLAVPFRPARLLLHDMLGIPALVDMMAMRDVLAESGGNPDLVDMSLPVDLVIDHSMTINHWAQRFALAQNMDREFEVNRERFAFLKACEARFSNLRVVPPGGGICHQVNLEYLGKTVLPASILKGAGNLFLQSYAQKKGFLQRSPIPKNPKKQLLQKCRCWPRPQFTQAS